MELCSRVGIGLALVLVLGLGLVLGNSANELLSIVSAKCVHLLRAIIRCDLNYRVQGLTTFSQTMVMLQCLNFWIF